MISEKSSPPGTAPGTVVYGCEYGYMACPPGARSPSRVSSAEWAHPPTPCWPRENSTSHHHSMTRMRRRANTFRALPQRPPTHTYTTSAVFKNILPLPLEPDCVVY